MDDSPIPPKPIVELALEVCAAAGFPATTPELDDKLRALGLLFGKAAPTSADLTHFLWHVLDGSVPLALLDRALAAAVDMEAKGLVGGQTRAVLSAAGADLPAIYGRDLIKNLAVILRSVVRRAVEMTTAGTEGEVAAARSERQATQQTVAALEADLTLICEAYRAAVVNPRETTAKAIAEHITAMTGSDKMLAWFQDLWGRTAQSLGLEPESGRLAGLRFELLQHGQHEAALRKVAELIAEVENLRALLKADEENSAPVTATSAIVDGRPVVTFPPNPATSELERDLIAKLSASEAHAARWLKACALAGWDPEVDARPADGPDKLVAFIERGQALLVKPLRDELRSRQAPNLAAFGYEKADPQRVVELAAERMRTDAREIGRLRAANRDLAAKIESAPGSGLRKRLKEALRLVEAPPREVAARRAELEKVQQQIAEAKAQRNAVLAAARRDPTGKDTVQADNRADRDTFARSASKRRDALILLGWDDEKDPEVWATSEAASNAKDRGALTAVRRNYEALAMAVCPFPKEHEKLLQQAKDARDRAAGECAKGLPDGYRLEEVLPFGWRWTTRVDTWGETLDSPGLVVRQAWRRVMGQEQNAHREAVRHAEKRLAELEGPVPRRSVLLAAMNALGWTPMDGDPEDWAIAEGRKLAAIAFASVPLLLPNVETQQALLDKARQLMHDAAACEQHRRQIDALDAKLGRMLGEHAENLSIDGRLNELAGQRDAYKRAAEPVVPPPCPTCHGTKRAMVNTGVFFMMAACPSCDTPTAKTPDPEPTPTARGSDKPSPVLDIRVGADEVDMQRIKDLLHERRVRLAVRDGEACTWPELVRGLLDDYQTGEANEQHLHRCAKEAGERAAAHAAKVAELEKQLAEIRGKGPSAADVLRGAWTGDTIKTEEVVSDVVWNGKTWLPRRLAELDAAWAKMGYAQPLTAESLKYVTVCPPNGRTV